MLIHLLLVLLLVSLGRLELSLILIVLLLLRVELLELLLLLHEGELLYGERGR